MPSRLALDIACIGGAMIDRTFVLAAPAVPRTSNPALQRVTAYGGVARNVAENAARLGSRTALVSVAGDDPDGRALIEHARLTGIDVRAMEIARGCATAEYVAVLDPGGDLEIGIAHAAAFDLLTPAAIDAHAELLEAAAWWFLDCNLPSETIAHCVVRARERGARIAVDAVSVAKSRRLPRSLDGIDVLFCNRDEAVSFVGETLDARACAQRLQSDGAHHAVVTDGARGAYIGDAFVPAHPATVVSATGAGDAFVGAVMHRMAAGDDLFNAVRLGMVCASLTVESHESVRSDLSQTLVMQRMELA